jgi:hypothetical protein
VTRNVTLVAYDVPVGFMAKAPTPATESETAVGGQPAASVYVTENVIAVVGVDETGEALPALSTGAWCEAPLQLAASVRA